jgi:prepilin-type N-terminal cleavage/methylation domain-containing protein
MRHGPRGFTLLEMLVVIAIIMLLASITIPNARRSRLVANEAAALEALTTLSNVCFIYWTEHDGYPAALADLGPGDATTPAASLIDPALASGTKSGYSFIYSPGPTDLFGKITTYSITATPIDRGATGDRSFFTDQTGAIRADGSGIATANSPLLN